jgi:hypothetical protein
LFVRNFENNVPVFVREGERIDRCFARDSGSTGPLVKFDRTRTMTSWPDRKVESSESDSQSDQKAFIHSDMDERFQVSD